MKKLHVPFLYKGLISRALVCLILGGLSWSAAALPAVKPKIWVITDIRRITASGDPDDIVTMSQLLLMANHFNIAGITAGADIRGMNDCGDAADWTRKEMYQNSYKAELANLNKYYGGYQENIPIYQSGWCSGTFKAGTKIDIELKKYESMKALIEEAKKGPIWISAWGEQTEFAYIAEWLLDRKMDDVLKNMKYIPHWTTPKSESNCARDAVGCNYVFDLTLKHKKLDYYNIGPIGEDGLVKNSCNDNTKFPMTDALASKTGNWLKTKIVSGTPDFSDGASYLILLGFAGGIESFKSDASYDASKNNAMCKDRKPIFDIMQRASLAAQGKGTFAPPFPETPVVGIGSQAGAKQQVIAYESGYLRLVGSTPAAGKVTVFDMHGRMSKRFSLNASEKYPLDLAEGLNVVKVESNGTTQWKTIPVLPHAR